METHPSPVCCIFPEGSTSVIKQNVTNTFTSYIGASFRMLPLSRLSSGPWVLDADPPRDGAYARGLEWAVSVVYTEGNVMRSECLQGILDPLEFLPRLGELIGGKPHSDGARPLPTLQL